MDNSFHLDKKKLSQVYGSKQRASPFNKILKNSSIDSNNMVIYGKNDSFHNKSINSNQVDDINDAL